MPTYNAGENWWALQSCLEKQGILPSQVLIVDSSSTDHTRARARDAGYQVIRIRKEEFGHGATRQLACSYMREAELLVFMTQDATLVSADSLEKLSLPFEDPRIGAVYGRQLPRHEADPIERHGRLFNYPDQSEVRVLEDRARLGFKTIFLSNSFAAYRRSALEEVGGFPLDAIVCEDAMITAKMLMADWKVAYQADAQAIHSHPLNLRDEFTRYFDTGVQHGRARWLFETFGGVNSNGIDYVKSEVRFLSDHAPLWLPYAAMRHLTKYVAYRLGTLERSLPTWLNKSLSNFPNFWDRQRSSDPSLASPRSAQSGDSSDPISAGNHPETSKPYIQA